MKRLLSVLLLMAVLLLAPFAVSASDFRIVWDTYPYPQATMSGSCGINGDIKVPVGSIAASVGALDMALSVTYGDVIECEVVATYGDKTSIPGGGSVTVPFPDLPVPSGVMIIVVAQ